MIETSFQNQVIWPHNKTKNKSFFYYHSNTVSFHPKYYIFFKCSSQLFMASNSANWE